MRWKPEPIAFVGALLLGVLPLWASGQLPLVDLPQHLHLISVLHRLDDPTTLYPQWLVARGQLTPYLGYYHAVSLLNWLMPLETANRVYLSAYVVGLVLALAFLLKSLDRPTWPSLLALPFAYGDSLAWGFINYCSALPLAFLACGLAVRTITEPRRRVRWAMLLGATLVAVLLFHVQVFAFLGLALPVLVLLTPTPTDGKFASSRVPSLLAALPSVGLFAVWIGVRFGEPEAVEYGAPWKAWGPLLSPENLTFKTLDQNLNELPQVLANMLQDGTDRYGVYAAIGVALVGFVASWIPSLRYSSGEQWFAQLRLPALAALALALYFLLPFDIRGYMYYLNTRYAHLSAPLIVAALAAQLRASALATRLGARLTLVGLVAGLLVAATTGLPLALGFRAFGQEAAHLEALVDHTAAKPMVMGLIYNAGSGVVRHPVFLHSAALLARERGGVPNFSFALTPHSPLKYRGQPPPTFPSEWRPEQFSWATHGAAYDHFLLRGAHPAQVFGGLLQGPLEVVQGSGGFWLVRRR